MLKCVGLGAFTIQLAWHVFKAHHFALQGKIVKYMVPGIVIIIIVLCLNNNHVFLFCTKRRRRIKWPIKTSGE